MVTAMTMHRNSEEADIRRQIHALADAIGAADLAAVESVYAADVVSFDAERPLRHVGLEAKSRNWQGVFMALRPPLKYDVRDLTILVSSDLAVAYSLNRLSGTAPDGSTVGAWVRWTAGLQKRDGRWLIIHDHVSFPFDPATGMALVDLAP